MDNEERLHSMAEHLADAAAIEQRAALRQQNAAIQKSLDELAKEQRRLKSLPKCPVCIKPVERGAAVCSVCRTPVFLCAERYWVNALGNESFSESAVKHAERTVSEARRYDDELSPAAFSLALTNCVSSINVAVNNFGSATAYEVQKRNLSKLKDRLASVKYRSGCLVSVLGSVLLLAFVVACVSQEQTSFMPWKVDSADNNLKIERNKQRWILFGTSAGFCSVAIVILKVREKRQTKAIQSKLSMIGEALQFENAARHQLKSLLQTHRDIMSLCRILDDYAKYEQCLTPQARTQLTHSLKRLMKWSGVTLQYNQEHIGTLTKDVSDALGGKYTIWWLYAKDGGHRPYTSQQVVEHVKQRVFTKKTLIGASEQGPFEPLGNVYNRIRTMTNSQGPMIADNNVSPS